MKPGGSDLHDPSHVSLPLGAATLEGNLHRPAAARAVVLFAHGSGSSRHSPRNRFVAAALQRAELATLLMDLLTAEEEAADFATARFRFDIRLLADRLAGAVHWLRRHPDTRDLPVGCFGSSTGAGAALVSAAELPEHIGAVVSRGGRPDLAGPALPLVRAPTLLIVGGHDEPVIALNRQAMRHLQTPHRLEIIPGATHLFEEPGALERVAECAAGWFTAYLAAR
jgi:putative phosphoribosyl transferase